MALPIGHIAGIRISVHISFLILVALVAIGATAPDQPAVIEQVAWMVVLFACVVAHELAHSLVARAHGVQVKEIELLPIGGLSKLESRPHTSRDELRIAGAGPVMSLLIGATIAAVAWAAGSPPWPMSVYDGPFVARVAWLNVLLAAFNLLPALPLDGGRVLRAALTPRFGHARATRVAATAGRVIAGLLIGVGFLMNFWLAVIGVFILFGALGEEAMLEVELVLAGVRVGDLPIHPLSTLPSDLSLVTVDEPVVGTPLLSDRAPVGVIRDGVIVGVARPEDLDALLRHRSARVQRSDHRWFSRPGRRTAATR
jgi:stage IV sporulation protein FB